MTTVFLTILFLALLADRKFGDPDWVWQKVPHPVVAFGRGVSIMEKWLRRPSDSEGLQYRKGALGLFLLIGFAGFLGWLLSDLFSVLGPLGWVLEIVTVTILLAQKSLADHVGAVAEALGKKGVSSGREAVGMIVGRETANLDRSGVCRAAIESLAENFSDGVVAPAFWYAVFGLPGLFIYKMINTADSMIGYRNEHYLWFGRAAARVDDLANWLPARIAAICIAAGGFLSAGPASGKRALHISARDAGLHASPNAGWPEAAMAGASDIALGGSRIYQDKTVPQAHMNASGKLSIDCADIDRCLRVYDRAGLVLIAIVGFAAVIALFACG